MIKNFFFNLPLKWYLSPHILWIAILIITIKYYRATIDEIRFHLHSRERSLPLDKLTESEKKYIDDVKLKKRIFGGLRIFFSVLIGATYLATPFKGSLLNQWILIVGFLVLFFFIVSIIIDERNKPI